MKKVLVGAALFALLVTAGFSAAQDKGAKPVEVPEQDVVVVELGEDAAGSDLTFDEPTTVRVAGSTPVGIGKLSVRVTGAAKLVRKTGVRRIIGGQKPIGAAEMEFEVLLSKGLSKVEVTSTVKGAEPRVETYKFEIK